MAVTLKNLSGKDIAYEVIDDGVTVGTITKGRGSLHPWRSYAAGGGLNYRKLLGSFYPEEGGKKAAVAAVLAAHRNTGGAC